MAVLKGFLIILLSGIAFALGGALIGYSLGVAMPGYYRAVFNSGREPWFDPVTVGLGLGLTQGLVCGVVIGAVVVLAVAWYNSRRREPKFDFRMP
jgi:hypothetical protein